MSVLSKGVCVLGAPLAAVVLLTAFAAGAATCVWTGNGGDYKWSTAENWDTLAVPVDGDNVTLLGRRNGELDPTPIENDIAGLTLNQLKFGNKDAAATTNITLMGEAITLKRTSGSDYNLYIYCGAHYRLTNYCALCFVTGTSGGTSKQGYFFQDSWFYQYGSVTVSVSEFTGMGNGGKWMYFYEPFDAPQSTVDFWYSAPSFYSRFKADILKVSYNSVLCYESDCISAREVALKGTWGEYKVYHHGVLDGSVVKFVASSATTQVTLYGDHVIDRLSGVAATNAAGVVESADRHRVRDNNYGSELTLRASQGDETWACVMDKLNLTYAPLGNYVYNLAGRVHTTSGRLKVNGGTLRLTHGGCFPNVTDVTVEKGATLDVASKNSSYATFSADARLVLATGAKLAVSNGCDFTVKTVVYGGVPVPAGTYTKATCKWLAGEGSVTVTTTGGGATYWKVAADGKWTDAENWTDGVPTESMPGYVFADGDTDYTVTLDETVTAPKIFGLRSGGAGRAILKIAEGGAWLGSEITDYAIGHNALWLVDGGWASVSNNSYNSSGIRLQINGDEGATGAVKVVSGTFKVAIHDRNHMFAGRWGRIDATGGNLYLLSTCRYQGESILWLRGGEVLLSGSATLYVNSEGVTGYGRLKMEDSSILKDSTYYNPVTKGSVAISQFGPEARSETDGDALWEVTENAVLGITSFMFISRGGRGCNSVCRYSSKARSPAAGRLAWSVSIGGKGGRGEFYQTDGEIHAGEYGTYIGGNVDNNETSGDGLLEVSGGLFNATCGGYNYGPGKLVGLAVGYGAYFANPTTLADWPFKGKVRVKDTGNVRLDKVYGSGYVTIGAGFGEGTWEQLGGSMTNSCMATVLGLAGGLGTLTMSGGVFRTVVTYLGGAETNRFTDGAGVRLVPNGNYPIDRHAGVGTLTIAGGSFCADYNTAAGVWMGLDGDGVLEMVGSKGAFKATYLTATNLLAGAGTATAHQTESTLKFIFDKDGVSPLDVTGKATLAAGTKVVVDFSDYEGRGHKFRLINAATTDFSPADLDVTFIDRNAERHGTKLATMSLVKDATGLAFKSGKRGVVLMLR